MANKVKIEDQNGVQVFPITHVTAVIDNNGNSVEQVLGAQTDLINQKQLEIGAVPSDLTPTENSTNWVTSGGLYPLQKEIFGTDETDITSKITVAQSNTRLRDGIVTSHNSSFISAPIHLEEGDYLTFKCTFYQGHDCISIINDNNTYTSLVYRSTGYEAANAVTVSWTATKDCNVVLSGYYFNRAVVKVTKPSVLYTYLNNKFRNRRQIDTSLALGGVKSTVGDVGSTFSFSVTTNSTYPADYRRILFEVTAGDKVYISKNPSIQTHFYGYIILDKNYIILKKNLIERNEILLDIPQEGKYVLFQWKTSNGAPTIYVYTEENIDEPLLENVTLGHSLNADKTFVFAEVGSKQTATETTYSSSAYSVSCEPGDVFFVTSYFTKTMWAVVDRQGIVVARDDKPNSFWHHGTKIVIPEGGDRLLINRLILSAIVKKAKKIFAGIDEHKDSIVSGISMYSSVSSGSAVTLDRRLRLSWATDTHGDIDRYDNWVKWTTKHRGLLDAALHTGDFNIMGDADNGFTLTASAKVHSIPFMPTLGNHDCFAQTVTTPTLNSGSLAWNGAKYITPFMDSSCVAGPDGCYYYRDFTSKKIRVIVVNDYDKPRWADSTYWVTTTDETEIEAATDWVSRRSYAVDDIVHYKGMYLKCKNAGTLDNNAHIWRPDRAPRAKTDTDCRYINQVQANFIINAMNVSSGWGIIFVTHQPMEPLPVVENQVSEWTIRSALVSTYIGVKHGQNGFMLQDLITAYLNKTTLSKTYRCITPVANPLGTVTYTNLPDFYPDVEVNADFTSAAGDILCCLHGHQHSDSAYFSAHTGDKKILCIGNLTDCYKPYSSNSPWTAGDIVKGGNSKDSFNVISIDPVEKMLYMVRIGADTTDGLAKREYIKISLLH